MQLSTQPSTFGLTFKELSPIVMNVAFEFSQLKFFSGTLVVGGVRPGPTICSHASRVLQARFFLKADTLTVALAAMATVRIFFLQVFGSMCFIYSGLFHQHALKSISELFSMCSFL